MKTITKMRRFPGASAATCLVFALTLGSAFAESLADLPAKNKFHMFLLIGQSNMAGRGAVTQADRQPHSRVLMFTKDCVWELATDPMHFDSDSYREFGERYVEAYRELVDGRKSASEAQRRRVPKTAK